VRKKRPRAANRAHGHRGCGVSVWSKRVHRRERPVRACRAGVERDRAAGPRIGRVNAPLPSVTVTPGDVEGRRARGGGAEPRSRAAKSLPTFLALVVATNRGRHPEALWAPRRAASSPPFALSVSALQDTERLSIVEIVSIDEIVALGRRSRERRPHAQRQHRSGAAVRDFSSQDRSSPPRDLYRPTVHLTDLVRPVGDSLLQGLCAHVDRLVAFVTFSRPAPGVTQLRGARPPPHDPAGAPRLMEPDPHLDANRATSCTGSRQPEGKRGSSPMCVSRLDRWPSAFGLTLSWDRSL